MIMFSQDANLNSNSHIPSKEYPSSESPQPRNSDTIPLTSHLHLPSRPSHSQTQLFRQTTDLDNQLQMLNLPKVSLINTDPTSISNTIECFRKLIDMVLEGRNGMSKVLEDKRYYAEQVGKKEQKIEELGEVVRKLEKNKVNAEAQAINRTMTFQSEKTQFEEAIQKLTNEKKELKFKADLAIVEINKKQKILKKELELRVNKALKPSMGKGTGPLFEHPSSVMSAHNVDFADLKSRVLIEKDSEIQRLITVTTNLSKSLSNIMKSFHTILDTLQIKGKIPFIPNNPLTNYSQLEEAFVTKCGQVVEECRNRTQKGISNKSNTMDELQKENAWLYRAVDRATKLLKGFTSQSRRFGSPLPIQWLEEVEEKEKEMSFEECLQQCQESCANFEKIDMTYDSLKESFNGYARELWDFASLKRTVGLINVSNTPSEQERIPKSQDKRINFEEKKGMELEYEYNTEGMCE